MFNKCDWNSAQLNMIALNVKLAGGVLWVVGGAVRDALMDIEPVDVDLMVSGISEDVAKRIFALAGTVSEADLISNAPVFLAKVAGFDFDVAMARIEVDVAPGKHGFVFKSSPEISPEEDARRRDFTIGAIFFDLLSGRIFDPFDGVSDLKAGIIRAVDPEHFVQSPERVLRGASQAARFGFDIAPFTLELMQSMKRDFDTVPKEQIWRHVEKTGRLACAPGLFFNVLEGSEWLEFFPEIKVLPLLDVMFDLEVDELCGSVPHFVAALIAGMSFNEEESFFDRIGAPKAVRRDARDIKEFGPDGRPKRWVEGRDIAHVIEPGPAMGRAVNWAWIVQINGIVANKAEAIAWVEAHKEEF